MSTEKPTTNRRARATAPKKETNTEVVVDSIESSPESVKEEVVNTIPESTPAPKLEPLTEDYKVLVVSNVTGAYGYSSPTGSSFGMQEPRQFAYIPLRVVRELNNTQGKHIKEGWIIIKDERVIDELHLRPVYQKVMDMDGIEELILYNPEKIEENFTKFTKHMKTVFVSVAKRLYKENQIQELSTIRSIQTVTGVNLLTL